MNSAIAECEDDRLFRVLAAGIPQLVFRTRPDGIRSWHSPGWCRFTGLDAAASLHDGWLAAIHPDDRALTMAGWPAARQAGAYQVAHRVRRAADGSWRWHRTQARPLDPADPDGGDWIGTMTDIDDQHRLPERQRLMMAELQHRTRNLLAVVQSIASQTARNCHSVAAFQAEFGNRLQALSRVQTILAQTERGEVDLRSLVTAELAAHSEAGPQSDKIRVEGPPVVLPATSAQAFGLALHELATNAFKYGALNQPSGRLRVRWQLERQAETAAQVKLEWEETGVRIAHAGGPERRGYGTELIERALPYQLRAQTRLEFRSGGVFCEIAVPLRSGGGHHA